MVSALFRSPSRSCTAPGLIFQRAQGDALWFCHTRPEDVDLFYLPYSLRQDRIARWLTGTVSAQRAATAAQKIATRGEIGGSGWSIGRLNLDANEKTLIAVRSPLRR